MKCFQRQSGAVFASCIGIGEAATFLLVFLPTLVYALVSPRESSESSRWWGHYSQGWPLVYLERQVDTGNNSTWLLWSGVIRVSLLMLLVNIVVTAAIALAAAYIWHLHTARHHWWQFTLKEMLCLTTVTAVGLSYFCLPALQRRREEAIAAQLEKMGWVLAGSEPVHPNVVMRPLLDLGILSRDLFWRFRSAAWQGRTSESSEDTPPSHNAREEAIDVLLDQTAQLLARMKYCDEIHICSSTLSDQGVRSLCTNWSGCRSADFSNSSCLTDRGVNAIVENWINLEELDLSGTDVSDEGILKLTRLPRLSSLSIAGADGISIDGTVQLLQHCRALKHVAISSDWLQDESFQRLRQLAEKRGVDVIAVSNTK